MLKAAARMASLMMPCFAFMFLLEPTGGAGRLVAEL
jgi:hypothetical protein